MRQRTTRSPTKTRKRRFLGLSRGRGGLDTTRHLTLSERWTRALELPLFIAVFIPQSPCLTQPQALPTLPSGLRKAVVLQPARVSAHGRLHGLHIGTSLLAPKLRSFSSLFLPPLTQFISLLTAVSFVQKENRDSIPNMHSRTREITIRKVGDQLHEPQLCRGHSNVGAPRNQCPSAQSAVPRPRKAFSPCAGRLDHRTQFRARPPSFPTPSLSLGGSLREATSQPATPTEQEGGRSHAQPSPPPCDPPTEEAGTGETVGSSPRRREDGGSAHGLSHTQPACSGRAWLAGTQALSPWPLLSASVCRARGCGFLFIAPSLCIVNVNFTKIRKRGKRNNKNADRSTVLMMQSHALRNGKLRRQKEKNQRVHQAGGQLHAPFLPARPRAPQAGPQPPQPRADFPSPWPCPLWTPQVSGV